LITAREAAKVYKTSPGAIRDRLRRRKIEGVKKNGITVWKEAQVKKVFAE
jgi:hypothetical protein